MIKQKGKASPMYTSATPTLGVAPRLAPLSLLVLSLLLRVPRLVSLPLLASPTPRAGALPLVAL